jgi:polyphosphate kinase
VTTSSVPSAAPDATALLTATRPAPAETNGQPHPAGSPPQPPAGRDSGPASMSRYLNRELSWLDFNARVLAIAEDDTIPLLERAKFLAIFGSNLDEFFMVRVAGLQRRRSMGVALASPDGLSASRQLDAIAAKAQTLVDRQSRCFAASVRPGLADAGLVIVGWDDLERETRHRLDRYFRAQVFPMLTPLAVDPAHPFPYISGLSVNLAVLVRDAHTGEQHFARVKVPNNLARLIDAGDGRFLLLEELVATHLDQLFPGFEVAETHLFRVTRNADLEVEEDRDENLLRSLERELDRRRFGPAVRLEVASSMTEPLLALLTGELSVSAGDVVRVDGLLDLSCLMELYGVDRPDLKDEPLVPVTHPRLCDPDVDLWSVLRAGDVLVQHPYHAFGTSVQRFVEEAAADPDVRAIKQTLYRTSGDSPIVAALIRAAKAGKQVVVLVEIKARFDETANIGWARALERAGCHVVYGFIGLKTHCKTSLVVRHEPGGVRRYAHVGTGNYNPKTARLYEDLGLMTANPDVCSDLTDLFNVLTGYSRQTEYRRLLVAPSGLRAGLLERIEREITSAREGRQAGIQFKMNSLVDEECIEALYRASQAGVSVDCVVRGICCLRPGVPGVSENIRVRSIVGRFLEHSRVYRFTNSGEPEIWIGSADLMHRNLDRRVEALVRVEGDSAQVYLNELMALALSDDVVSWELAADGSWRQLATKDDGTPREDLQRLRQRATARTSAG